MLTLALLLAACSGGGATPTAQPTAIPPTESPAEPTAAPTTEPTTAPAETTNADLDVLTSTTWMWTGFTDPTQQYDVEAPGNYTLAFPFAAFYPNCPGVFGFHDGAPPAPLEGVRYELLGWFSTPDVHDGLLGESFASALEEARTDAARRKETVSEVELKRRALKAAFGWELGELPAAFPERTVFHARITVGKAAEDKRPTAVTVAVGNTVTEVLSAYVAKTKAAELGKTRSELEEQLEALHLADRIDH